MVVVRTSYSGLSSMERTLLGYEALAGRVGNKLVECCIENFMYVLGVDLKTME